MTIGLALGLGAALAWGLVDVFGALAGRRLGSLRVLAGSQITSLVLLLGVVVIMPERMGDTASGGVRAGLVFGVVAGLAYVFAFTALRIGPLSVVSPVIAAYGGLMVVLAVILRGESLTVIQGAGALLSTVGVVFTGILLGRRVRSTRLVGPGVILAAVTMVLFAILTVGLAAPIQEHGWLPVIVGSRISNTTTVLLLLALSLRWQPRHLQPLLRPSGVLTVSAIVIVLGAGIFDFAGFIAYAVGLEIAPTWLVGLVSSFGPVVAVLVAIVGMGERLRPNQWAGLVILGIGIALIALPG
jgi:drug/metabolite transporter (DMT)-like permease